MFLLPWFDCRFVWTPALPWRLREAPCLLRPQSQGNESCGKDLGTFGPVQQVCIVQRQSLWSASWNASLRHCFLKNSTNITLTFRVRCLVLDNSSLFPSLKLLCIGLNFVNHFPTIGKLRPGLVKSSINPIHTGFGCLSNWNFYLQKCQTGRAIKKQTSVLPPNAKHWLWKLQIAPGHIPPILPIVPFISTWPPPTQTSRIALHQLEWLQSSPQEIFYTFHYIPTYLNAF